jgi:2-iminobutanoate/2-iminopropanoate deaminase
MERVSTDAKSITRVFPHNSPTPRGPYSPAVRAGDFIYVSGQGPIDPVTDKLSIGDIKHETHLVLSNIQRILAACDATMADVVKCSVFLREGPDFPAMNEVYKQFFGDTYPARTTVVCTFSNPAMRVEIDAIAYKPVK